MRIGVFGGTFDPPHLGHLIVAQDACDALRLDRMLFIVAARPPHKQNRSISDPETRLEMVRRALADAAHFVACDIELRRPGASYMVDTLQTLRDGGEADMAPAGAELFLLLGADQFRELGTWREPERIGRLAHLALLTRAGVSQAGPTLDLPHEVVEVTRIDISATEIRRRVAEGRSIRYLVPDAVAALIAERGLYRGVL